MNRGEVYTGGRKTAMQMVAALMQVGVGIAVVPDMLPADYVHSPDTLARSVVPGIN